MGSITRRKNCAMAATQICLRLVIFALIFNIVYGHDLPSVVNRNIIDMTHDFAEDETIYWPGSLAFNITVTFKGNKTTPNGGFYYESNNYCAAEHGGTHLDSPNHFADGAWSIEQIPVDRLIGEAAVVDVKNRAMANRDYQATVADIEKSERLHGKIPDDSILLLYTGWEQYWPNKLKYLGTDTLNTTLLHFPGLHPDAARWLVKNRKIKAFGLDTASVDYGQSQLFMTHTTLFAANIPGIENLVNISKLQPRGDLLIGLPMKIRGGSGAPLRMIAVVGGSESNSAHRQGACAGLAVVVTAAVSYLLAFSYY